MVPDQRTLGTWNPKNLRKDRSVQNAVRLLYNYIWHTEKESTKNHSLNLSLHRINCKCHLFLSTSFKIKYIPVYILKIDVLSLFLLPIDVSMVRPQSSLQLDWDLFLSWCRQSQGLRQAGETRRPDHTPTGPAASRNRTAVFSSIYVRLIQPAMHNNELQRVGQSLACTW